MFCWPQSLVFCNAYTCLLALWPSITMAYENIIADENIRSDSKAKVTGYLIKLRSYSFLCLVCAYLDILKVITSISNIFELEALMHNEVKPLLLETVSNIDACKENARTRCSLAIQLGSVQWKVNEHQCLLKLMIHTNKMQVRNVSLMNLKT